MSFPLPTQRLSPKNQISLARSARALAGADADGHVCGGPQRLRQPHSGEVFNVLVLMTEGELVRREQGLRVRSDLGADQLAYLIAQLNGTIQRMNLDGQRRIVLPAHFVSFLRLERELYLFSTNSSVLVWHPQDYLRYAGLDAEPGPGLETAPVLLI